ncbi:MAG: hypothetical protein H6Q67_1489 [Firmicutes bacterium]|nr:hypothetical protein [Bacillota bacterium]
MSVIDKIERGELKIEVGFMSERKIYVYDSEDAAELLRLARLGLAAEKGFNNDPYFKCDKKFGSRCADPGMCVWEDFCRLRTPGGADNG